MTVRGVLASFRYLSTVDRHTAPTTFLVCSKGQINGHEQMWGL